jgi:hypothetical protein
MQDLTGRKPNEKEKVGSGAELSRLLGVELPVHGGLGVMETSEGF